MFDKPRTLVRGTFRAPQDLKNLDYIAKAVRIKERIVQKSVLYIGTADKMYEKLKIFKKN